MAHKKTPNVVELDAIAWKIVESLAAETRACRSPSWDGKVGLSTPAVAERVHRLEEAGVISGYHAEIDVSKLGIPIRVVDAGLTIPGGELQMSRTVTAIKELHEISRCHRITGHESFVIEADVVSIRHMETLIAGSPHWAPLRLLPCFRHLWSGASIRRTDRVVCEVSMREPWREEPASFGGQNRVIRGLLAYSGSSSHTLHLTTREVRALKSAVEADPNQ